MTGDISANFDSVFWLGDLNFRIDKGRHTVEDIVKAIVEQDHPNFEDLLRTDELLNCLLHGKKKIKTDIKFSTCFWNNLQQVAQDRKIGQPNNLKFCEQ